MVMMVTLMLDKSMRQNFVNKDPSFSNKFSLSAHKALLDINDTAGRGLTRIQDNSIGFPMASSLGDGRQAILRN